MHTCVIREGTIVFMGKKHCHSNLGHCMCVKVYHLHVGKVRVHDKQVNSRLFCFWSALAWQEETDGQEVSILDSSPDEEEITFWQETDEFRWILIASYFSGKKCKMNIKSN